MLSEEQKNEVAKWFAAGEGVAEIQKHISAEFNIDMTYLDVRLLVADLPQPVEPDEAKAEEPVPEMGAEWLFTERRRFLHSGKGVYTKVPGS